MKLAINLEHFDIEKLTRETEGYVFESIALIIKNAMIKAKINNEPITQELLEKSFDEIIGGLLEDTKTLPEEQKELLAVHQAGHALANILLNPRMKLFKVTIQKVRADVKEQSLWAQVWQKENEKSKSTEYGRLFFTHEKDSLEYENKDELLKQCKVMLAGHIAERVLLGSCSYSYHAEDRKQALKMSQSIVFGGLTPDQLPKNVKDQCFSDAYNLMVQCEQEIESLLQEHKAELTILAQALKDKGTIDIQTILTLLSQEEGTKSKKEETSVLDLLSQQKTPIQEDLAQAA